MAANGDRPRRVIKEEGCFDNLEHACENVGMYATSRKGMNRIRRATSLAPALLAALLLLACGPTPTGQPTSEAAAAQSLALAGAAQAEPGTLRVGTTYIWDTANPATGWYNPTLRSLLYDTLVEWAGGSDFLPGLATGWSAGEHGRVWTFSLRPGVTFHDGSPCTADDVAWSLNWTIENKIETFGFYLAGVSEIVALDPATLQITFSEPVANVEYLLSNVWILPRSVWGDMTGDEIREFEDLVAGTGSGPFHLVDWVKGEHLVLEANEDYWRGVPHLDRVVWQEYTTEEEIVEALLAGEIDATAAGTVPLAAVEDLKVADSIQVAIMDSMRIDELIINSHKKGSQPASLNDPQVRLAMAHTVDKQQIVDVAYLGYAEPASVLIPPAMGDWHNDDVQDIPFDPKEGNLILDHAGYLDKDDDGIREDGNGNPLEYRLYGARDDTSRRILEIISDGLAQIGISALPTPIDAGSLMSLYPDFDFDLIYGGWVLDPDPDFAMLIFTCDQRQDGGWNDSGYCDEEFEELYQQQAITVDHGTRRDLIWNMERKLFDERPYIALTYLEAVQAYRSDRFQGFGTGAGDILWKGAFLPVEPVE
jgi:peptide/nickel transport system substrate-binding protein